jgi:hypothetical protein
MHSMLGLMQKVLEKLEEVAEGDNAFIPPVIEALSNMALDPVQQVCARCLGGVGLASQVVVHV